MRLEQLLQGNAIGIDLFNRGLAEARRRFAESDPRAKREAELKKRVDELNREDPLAAFRSGVAELFDLAQRGLSPAALQRRREELFGAARAGLPEIQEPQFAGAALAGTQEAFSAILRATAQNEQLGEARKQTAWLERIERAVIEAKRETTVAGPFA
jgi:hypothetical protein